MSRRDVRTPEPGPRPRPGRDEDLDWLVRHVARGDEAAFEAVYDQLSRPVYGLVRRVLRDPAQSEEVTQEVLLEVWRTASRFDAAKGSALTWVMTMAHRRAIDRVRSASAQAQREQKAGPMFAGSTEEVVEAVEARMDAERVRRCLDSLTELQRESVGLAYYGGYTYQQVAGLLDSALGTVKTRIRDGLIRMRDCMGVSRVRFLRRRVAYPHWRLCARRSGPRPNGAVHPPSGPLPAVCERGPRAAGDRGPARGGRGRCAARALAGEGADGRGQYPPASARDRRASGPAIPLAPSLPSVSPIPQNTRAPGQRPGS